VLIFTPNLVQAVRTRAWLSPGAGHGCAPKPKPRRPWAEPGGTAMVGNGCCGDTRVQWTSRAAAWV